MNLINLQQWQPPWIFLLTYQNRQNGFELFWKGKKMSSSTPLNSSTRINFNNSQIINLKEKLLELLPFYCEASQVSQSCL